MNIDERTAIEPALERAGGRRIYYGWIMLPIATMAMVATSPGQTFSVSTFNTAIRESLGLSHSQLTGAYMVGTFLASLPMAWVGGLLDRFGLRKTMTGVVILFGSACIAASQARGLLTIFLAFLMLRMLGQGSLGLLSGTTLPFWFRRRLGTVEGIRNFGMAGAISIVPYYNFWLINSFGWRTAWVMLGVTVWAVMLPLMLLFRNRPDDVGQRIDGEAIPEPNADTTDDDEDEKSRSFTFRQACRTRAFWIVCCVTALWSMMGTAVLFNIVPALESRGLADTDAARFFMGYAVSLAAMQVIGGALADRLPATYLLAISMALLSGAMFQLLRIESAAMVIPLAATMGAGQGTLVGAVSPLWPRYYGTTHIGKIRGSLATVLVSASSVGPFILGLCVDLTGSYNIALFAFMLLPLPMMLIALFATPPVKKRIAVDEAPQPHEQQPLATATDLNK